MNDRSREKETLGFIQAEKRELERLKSRERRKLEAEDKKIRHQKNTRPKKKRDYSMEDDEMKILDKYNIHY